MKTIKNKFIQIYSNGSVNFSYTIYKDSKKLKLYRKDNQNYSFYNKSSNLISKNFINYKKKYLVKNEHS